MAALLVGPPEIYPNSSSSKNNGAPGPCLAALMAGMTLNNQQPAAAAAIADGHALKKTRIPRRLRMGLTENNSPTFLSTGDPCLDFFFHVVPYTPPETLISRLQLAWVHDPLKALKLVCNLRGVRGTGKSDKEGFYTAALWLHECHPKTLAANVAAIADFGYFKDLLEILFRILEGPDARELARKMGEKWKSWKSAKDAWEKVNKALTEEKKNSVRRRRRGRRYEYGMNRIAHLFRSRKGLKRQLIESRKVLETGQTREMKRVERAKRVVERFNGDPNFKHLHDQISHVFARCLRSDMAVLKAGDLNRISLAAKWCPSLDSSFDRITLLCETIAKKVFPREEYPEYDGVEEAHYAYRVRDRLRKEVLVPLRRALELPEVFIGANDWGSLPYNRVASVAMKTHTIKFLEHDGERFREYLDKVERGQAKIAAGALLPHQIIAAVYKEDEDEDEDEDKNGDEEAAQVAELQWKRMVEDMAKMGALKNCLAVCDVSGSMAGIPMEVSVALGILVSELSQEPWKGKLITFSEDPQLQIVEGESLRERVSFVKSMDWGMNTDFQKVFDVMLQVAVEGKLKSDEMVKRVFVFSDMEFDQASENPWETDYEAIVRKYRENGYGECVPEMVFWNLRDSMATPVAGNQQGVALVSGYSKNLMTVFLENGGIMDPVAVMEAAISGKEYDKLVVID